MDTLEIIAKNLISWRTNEDITQAEVGRRAKVSPTYVNQIEKLGNPNPGIQQLEKIAAVFGRTAAELLRDPKDPGGHTTRDCLMVARRFLLEGISGDE